MDVELRLSENFPSTAVSNFWGFLTKPWEVDCRILSTSWINLIPQGVSSPIIPIIYGEDVSKIPITLSMPPGMLPLMPVLLNCRLVLDVHAPPDAMSTNVSFVSGIRSVGGVNIITKIPVFVSRGKTGMVRQLNIFCSKIPLLV